MPFFYPGNTQEILDYGLLAIALSRFSGAWVGMKMVTDVCDGGGTVEVDPERLADPHSGRLREEVDARLVIPVHAGAGAGGDVYRRLEAAREFARAESM